MVKRDSSLRQNRPSPSRSGGRILILIIAVVSVLVIAQTAEAAWLAGYTTRKKLTIDSSKIDAALTNLPVLVKLTSSNFDFSKDNDDGFDIRFTKADGTTLLKYERERHTDPNAEYWVKIPTVSNTADTDFYMYYTTIDTADGADPTNVWDDNYVMVHHMDDDPDNEHIDDSTTNNDGTKKDAGDPAETEATPKIAKAQHFDNSYIDVGDGTHNTNTACTLSAWVRTDTIASGRDQIISSDTGSSERVAIERNTDYIAARLYTGTLYDKSSTTIAADTWYHIGLSWDGTTLNLYLDGIVQTGTNTGNAYSNDKTIIGASTGLGYSWDGIIDEVRICDDARTAAEIKADYNSGNDSLLTYGSEQVGPAGIFFGPNF